ncbi:MAG: DUF1926 domain-containing protein [Chlamydiae bacterium]|nr:DUF1926 domain-containing protein [Chlamydiota bacterium]MBI3276717.1 DUF1926 domain-containing protein [Chlamydiota bacterium]
MGQIDFLFGIHNHQPVGNFEWVFEEAISQCYQPLLEVLSRHPKVRLSIHHTGPLLEWIEEHRPDYFEKLKNLLNRNQVELMGGAFYEPLIATLPERDAIGQIQMMTQYLMEKFGVKPKGMWLAERVWEPQLASIIKEAGMEYTLLDDTHFYYAGLQEKDMFGYYTTEDKGKTLSIFPINKNLRYLIPFNIPEKAIEFLGSIASDHPGRGVTLGDDGEKFGLWPGTHHWVYEERYLERLFTLLEENAHWIKMETFSEYLANNSSQGRIYLPNASYEEMMEWSLPTQAQKLYESSIHELKSSGKYEALKPFLRGGFWRNFFSKYPESNLMHKKMIYVSEQVSKLSDSSKNKKLAQKELWKGQCNCPYWHGLFGGLYLNYLRHANYTHLIKAEKIALNSFKDKILIDERDYDCDGKNEILLTANDLNLYLKPEYGGSIFEIDYRPKDFNLTNVLTRREESYHEKIALAQKAQQNSSGEQPKSIHDLSIAKEEGLEKVLFYDWYSRHSLIDHFIKPGTTLEEFYQCCYREEGDFVNQPYQASSLEKNTNSLSLTLKRNGHLFREGKNPIPLYVQKIIQLQSKLSNRVSLNYEICSLQNIETCWFGVEFNLTLLAGNDKKKYYRFNSQSQNRSPLGLKGEFAKSKSLELVNEDDGFITKITSDQESHLWYFPLETISQSESGFERTYQGSSILFLWKLQLTENAAKNLKLELVIE